MLNLSNWFIFALISALCLGTTTVLLEVIMGKGLTPVMTTAFIFSVAGIFLWGFILFTQKVVFPTNKILISLLIVTGIISAIASLTLFTSIKFASNPGYSRAISSLSILVAFTISIFVFNLKFDTLGFIGVFLILAGAMLLSRVV
jgi:uncharacterized membrane protein